MFIYYKISKSDSKFSKLLCFCFRSCGSALTLEVYRRPTPNGLVPAPSTAPPRPPTVCSGATSASLDFSRRRLQLPQVTFSSEVGCGVLVWVLFVMCIMTKIWSQEVCDQQKIFLHCKILLSNNIKPLVDWVKHSFKAFLF